MIVVICLHYCVTGCNFPLICEFLTALSFSIWIGVLNILIWILLIFQVEDVLRLEPVGAGRAGPELVPLLCERVGEAHDAAALDAVTLRLTEERGDVARLLGGVGAAAAAAQEEPLVAQLALPTQGALKKA